MSKDFEIIATLVPNPYKKKPVSGMRYFSLYLTQRLSGKYNGKGISESADMEHIYNWDYYKNFILENKSLKVVFAGNENDVQSSILPEATVSLDPNENLNDFIADEYKSENLWKKIFKDTPVKTWSETETVTQSVTELETEPATEQALIQNKMPEEFIDNFGREINERFDIILKRATPLEVPKIEDEKRKFNISLNELKQGHISFWQIEVNEAFNFDKKKYWDKYKKLVEIRNFQKNSQLIHNEINNTIKYQALDDEITSSENKETNDKTRNENICKLKEENKTAQEFHAKVSSLSQYSLLMRHLGLIIDCKIEQKNIPQTAKVLKIKFDNSSFNDDRWKKFFNEVDIYTPWTFFDPLTFTPKCQGSIEVNYLDIENGYISCKKKDIYEIRADQKSFKKGMVAALNEYNVDIKTITADIDKKTLLENALKHEDKPTTSDGVSIILDYNESREHKPVNSDINSGKAINDYIIFANNLDIGYRIDVSKGDGNGFLPLCAREIQLIIDRNNTNENDSFEVITNKFNEEYWVAESITMGNNNAVPADEEITRWNNWSLVCPLPTDQKTAKNNVLGDLELSVNLPEKSSVTPLRFGSKYHFRVRTVDLCGNGPDPSYEMPENENFKFNIESYKRYEPINPPELFMTENIFDSNSEIKPRFIGEDNNVIIIKTKIIDGEPYLGKASIRLISPPRATFNFAELHGVFDEFYKQNSKENINKLEKVYKLACYDSKDNKEIFKTESLLPFLTDPVVESLNITLVSERSETPGEPKLEQTAIIEAWKDEYVLRKFYTIALGQADSFNLKKTSEVTSIQLRAGEKAKVELNAVVNGDYNKIFNGKVIKPKTLSLIHAVQRPVLYENGKSVFREEYNISSANVFKIEDRDINETKVKFKLIDETSGKFPVRCCGQINLIAEYTDIIVDRFNENESKVVVNEIKQLKKSYIIENSEKKQDLIESSLFNELKSLEHTFGDTKFRKVKYKLEGVSKYEQYFPGETSFNCFWGMGESIVKNSKKPDVPIVDSVVPVFTWVETKTTVKRINSAFRIYLKGDWYLSGSEEKLAVLFLDRTEEGTMTDIDRATIPDDCEGLVSEFGKDPTSFQKPISSGIINNLFKNAVIVGEQSHDVIDIRLLESGGKESGEPVKKYCVNAAVFEVLWDHTSKRFYSEITINNDILHDDYCPFLKFVVSRYQMNSIKKDIPVAQGTTTENNSFDFRFSNVIVCPQVQILPVIEIDKVKMKFEKDHNRKKNKLIEQYLIMEKIKEVDTAKLIDDKEILTSTKAIPLYKDGTAFEMGPFDEYALFDDSKLHNDISDFNPDSIFIEEYEKHKVDEKFVITEGVDYNPRNDIRKRLVFTYKIK